MAILKTKRDTNRRVEKLKKTLISAKSVTPLNLLIDSDLHRRFKVKTINQFTSMTDVILDAIKQYLKN